MLLPVVEPSQASLETKSGSRFAYGYSEDPCCKEEPNSALTLWLDLEDGAAEWCVAYSSAAVDERESTGPAKASVPYMSHHESAHLRQDAHPCTHDNTSQTKDWYGMKVSLFTVREHCCMFASISNIHHTFNSWLLPKRYMSLASSLVPCDLSSELSLSAARISTASCVFTMIASKVDITGER